MTLPLTSPPDSLCILRLSAVGDISHTLPVVRTIQHAWPHTRLTWIIGKSEHSLVYDIPDIEFIVFDKKAGWRGYLAVRRHLRGRRFDALLHMQMSLRASMLSLFVHSPIKLGFDRERAKDLQWLFSNHKITYQPRQHVIDSFFGFSEALGITHKRLQWDIPIPDEARTSLQEHLPSRQAYLVISPCSSMAYRNWDAMRYAEVARYASEKYGLAIVLSGGPSAIEHEFARIITAHCRCPITNLIGKTTLKQLLALLQGAKLVIAPDAGPAHLANAVGTPVIGLYATTNPDRARPYNWPQLVVNRYPEAVHCKYGKAVEALPWGIRIRDSGTMSRISIEDVTAMLDKFMQENTV
jgi:heptosyltransferase I